ncbi:MAG: transporter substrate-binding domain-containing protein [Rhodospirillaceae bacterium]|nr:transporter substrate-binding domain-containing protein [Rhodospirillaceae bacterium]
MKRRAGIIGWLFVFCGAVFLAFGAIAQTQAETKPPLRIAIDRAYSPYSVISPTGKATGLAVEIWRAWSRATKTPVEFVPSGWEGTLDALRDGRVDIHFGMFKSASRAQWADFAEPIHHIHTALFFRADDTPVSLKQLAGEKVGAWAASYQYQFLKDKHPEVEVVASSSDDQLTLKLLKGEVRAIISEVPSVEAGLAAFGIRGVLARGEASLFANYLHPAVRKGDEELLERINAGFRAIPSAQFHALEKMWISNPADHFFAGAGGEIEFTPEEEAWLAANPVSKLAVTTFIRPVDIVDEAGNYRGLNADLIAMLNKKLGIDIVPEFFDTWGGVVEAITTGKVDGAFSLSITPEREKTVLFTAPYAFDPIIAVVPRADEDVASWKDLNAKTVSVVKGASIIEEIQDMIGDGVLVEVESEIDGLKAVAFGTADVHVSWLLPYGNAQRADPIDGLKIALTRNSEGGTLRIGIHNDRPELLSILRKGLNAISREELSGVRNKWLFAGPDGDGGSKIELTREEAAWIAKHPEITLAATSDWPPFEFKTKEGVYKGITAAIARLAASRAGLSVKPVFEPWEKELRMLRQGKLDLAPGLYQTEEREEFLLFTRPFIEFYDAIYTQTERDDIHTMADLSGKTIAAEGGYAAAENVKTNFPDIKITHVTSTLEALKLVSSAQVDAYIGNQVVAEHLINDNLLQNVTSAGFYSRDPTFLAMAVPKDRVLLRDIMDKALAAMTEAERRTIMVDYLGTEEMKRSGIQLTQAERGWLKEHRVVRMADDFAWAPFSFINDDGVFSGIAAGYAEVISERTGIEFKPQTGLAWNQVLEKIKQGEVDVLPAVAWTEARATFLNFTKPYISLPIVVATRKDGVFVDSLDDLAGLKVGVVDGYVAQEILARDRPTLEYVALPNLAAGLEALEAGKVDAFVDNLGSITYEIDKRKFDNIKIAAPTKYRFELAFAVRKDWPQLAVIFDKALESISEKERAGIKNTWMAVELNFGLDLKTVLLWVLPIGLGAAAVIVVILLWNRRMGAEIFQRKKAERELSNALGVITESIDYAANIQRAVLVGKDMLTATTDEHMILWEPRDVVGGDIYWCHIWGDGILVVLADCTGHGVPGAFMTLLSTGALDRAMADVPQGMVGELVQRMHQVIQITLNQHGPQGNSDDGLELGACFIHADMDKMTFAGARFPLFIVVDDEVREIKSTRKGIGYRGIAQTQAFDEIEIELKPGMAFYMSSDGFLEQVGGPKRRMFGKKRFKALLKELQALPLNAQKERFMQALHDHQGPEPRRDDVAVLAFRV